MPRYSIPVQLTLVNYVNLEADSLDSAVNKVKSNEFDVKHDLHFPINTNEIVVSEIRYAEYENHFEIDENDKVKIRGFETVRRDWCALSRKLQSQVL